MGTYRKRWNEKARAGQAAKLKELKRIRNKQFTKYDDDSEQVSDHPEGEETSNPNAEVLPALTAEEKEQKKRKLEELFTPKETKISRKKKKRLEKFIEHQLKREEKKEIISKLQDYKIDTSILTSSKGLGHGRKTRKEEFAEALKLEKQGLGDEQTREVLYEEHKVRSWEADNADGSGSSGGGSDDDSGEDDEVDAPQRSVFVDNRPAKFGGFGSGFSFANAVVVDKGKSRESKKKYNWRQRLEQEERRKHEKDDDNDFASDSESESNDDVETSDSSSAAEDDSQPEDDTSKEDTDPENKIDKFKHSKVGEQFKEWANSEMKRIEGRDKEYVLPTLEYKVEARVRMEDLDDGLQADNVPVDESSTRKAFVVDVQRPDTLQAVRMQLPVFAEEHRIMEAIHHNDVVIICGATGSGKTTQVPQFLYESGYGHPDAPDTPGMIAITQPRRVAAVSMAKRVGSELGNHGDKVAYQIRFDSTTKEDTRVKFMTDGVLLREMMNDFRLTKYSCIIIDEAHERNINTDILIGMLSRCVKLRAKEHSVDPVKNKKLKLIIMSATLRVADFSENSSLFATPPPVLEVEARQYPVAIHFNRKTSFDYAEEAFKKTCKIHRRLPPGAILIFMTGQQEITHMVKRLRNEFPFAKNASTRLEMESELPTVKVNPETTDMEVEDIDFSVKISQEEYDDGLSDAEGEHTEDSEEEEGFEEELEEGQSENDPLYVLPLYSLLPTKEQMKVFADPPKGSRLCVVATNVAETSLTIPGVRYVVDCGRSKERNYNEESGVQSFEIEWISKASADQRSGRAGRTGPGHCYRLYSSAVYERDFQQFSRPEILRMPVETVVLQMKSMSIHRVTNFPFPTPPERTALGKAVELLQHLGALDESERITADGRKMSLFPLSPRFAKMLLVSDEQGCLPYIVAIVSILSVGDPFISENELGIDQVDAQDGGVPHGSDEQKRQLRARFHKSRAKFSKLDPHSDVFRLLSAVSALDYVPTERRNQFLHDHFLRGKVMDEVCKLRKQVLYIIRANTSRDNVAVAIRDEELRVPVPSPTQLRLLKQMVAAGFIDQVAARADLLYPDDAPLANRAALTGIPYLPVLARYTRPISDAFVYVHSASVLATSSDLPPAYVVYHSLHRSATGTVRMRPLCDIKSTPLANVARSGCLLTYSKPLITKGLRPHTVSAVERYCYVTPRFGAAADSDTKIGWDLNPIPVHQKRTNGRWLTTKILTKAQLSAHTVSQ
ncbi:AFR222Wp [Eremothecium gossypii ATCC 10895]|uniref:RNA helicase n=1 Tax=Eremothecium gossypii (strain ATCC 10895 / CBS 109.51 / FGSC 9923 / NRRL Y-1056) TaxID=284811 RepID=Q753V3_EREGS|nr:AFR222Wp [Eremothecium gossypii ATCC 10895]AAS53593.2 AFR222Wp [Eremothecium gossypii ATCC 10895]